MLGWILLAGCTRDFSSPPEGPSQAPARPFTAMEKAALASSNHFGFNLFAEVCREEGRENVFLSPLSVSMALGMTLNGAAGRTETDMRHTLGFGDMAQEDINASYRGILDLLPAIDPKTVMEIANSIWYRQGVTVLPVFIETNRVFFDALVQELDFASPQAPDIINGWISGNTHGKIDRMIDEIDPSTVMFLINAVYFKGTWVFAFDPKGTRDDLFIPSDGPPIPCKMMSQKARVGYLETDTFQAVDLPYGNGRFSMTVFLPKTGVTLDALQADFTPDHWAPWKDGFAEQEVSLFLPKFKVEYEIKLNDALAALGMAVAFGGGADFSRIAESRDLYIDNVKHKSFVEVDEQGTEAAAVTVVEIRETAIPNEIRVRVDRPFLFVIREKSSDAMLFVGKIEELN
jgi:serpin B